MRPRTRRPSRNGPAYARFDASAVGQQGLVLEAMGRTKRHLFIPEQSCSIAYADRSISIGHGQTMSHRGLDDLDYRLVGRGRA